jgi:hypothetical protein
MTSCENGTAYTSKAMFIWREETNVRLGFIQPYELKQPFRDDITLS